MGRGVTSIARRYDTDEPPQDPKLKVAQIGTLDAVKVAMAQDDIKAMGRKMAALQTGHDALRGEVATLVARVSALEAAPRGTDTQISVKAPTNLVPSRGRPAKLADEPWKSEGISRRTWFRRQKAVAK